MQEKDTMEEQELRKLKRVELLEIMVEQGKAVGELRQQMEEQEAHIKEIEAELQEKNETIERLKEKLNQLEAEKAPAAKPSRVTLAGITQSNSGKGSK